MKNTIFFVFIFLFGCSSKEMTKETITIRTDTLYQALPPKFDTVFIKDNFTGENVRYIVKIDTLWKKIFINAKAETVKVAVTDTMRLVETRTNEVTFKDKVFYAVVGIALFIIAIGLLVFAVKSMKIF